MPFGPHQRDVEKLASALEAAVAHVRTYEDPQQRDDALLIVAAAGLLGMTLVDPAGTLDVWQSIEESVLHPSEEK